MILQKRVVTTVEEVVYRVLRQFPRPLCELISRFVSYESLCETPLTTVCKRATFVWDMSFRNGLWCTTDENVLRFDHQLRTVCEMFDLYRRSEIYISHSGTLVLLDSIVDTVKIKLLNDPPLTIYPKENNRSLFDLVVHDALGEVWILAREKPFFKDGFMIERIDFTGTVKGRISLPGPFRRLSITQDFTSLYLLGNRERVIQQYSLDKDGGFLGSGEKIELPMEHDSLYARTKLITSTSGDTYLLFAGMVFVLNWMTRKAELMHHLTEITTFVVVETVPGEISYFAQRREQLIHYKLQLPT